MKKTLSIIIPIYNSEKYLRKTLESVLSSELNEYNMELILIDDGSTDSSEDICKIFMSNFKDIIKYRKIDNSGVSHARNIGLDMATGDYIYFLDSDDIVFSNTFKILLDNINEYEMIIGGFKIVNNDYVKELLGKNLVLEKSDLIILQQKELLNNLSNKIFKAEIIKNNFLSFDTSLEVGEDLVFVLNYIRFIKTKILMKKDLVYEYYIRNNGANMKIRFDATKNSTRIHRILIDLLENEFSVEEKDILEFKYIHVKSLFRRYKSWLLCNKNYFKNYVRIKHDFKELNLTSLNLSKSEKFSHKLLAVLIHYNLVSLIFLFFLINK